MLRCRFAAGVVFAAALAACGSRAGGIVPPLVGSSAQRLGQPQKIQHVVVVIQENRSFDNFFATFPGADGASYGEAEPMPPAMAAACKKAHMPAIRTETKVKLTEVDLLGNGFPNNFGANNDLPHMYAGFQLDWDHAKMDGFDLGGLGVLGSGNPACTYPYQYVNPTAIAPYWTMAKEYVLADHTFQPQGSGSFTAHQELIAGGTRITTNEALIDTPSWFPWGCDGRAKGSHPNVTAIIKMGGGVYKLGGPFPCLTYTTMRDLLDAKSVSWKFYAVGVTSWKHCPTCEDAGIWSAFDAIKAVRYSPEWHTNVTRSPNEFFHDITAKRLPAVSWITPNGPNSDHPGNGSETGPSWVASLVNAVGKSEYWKSTAIVIVWDDWGGMYDHVAPPTPRTWEGGPGFRIPMLIVSPYVKPHVDHTVYEFGSILHFIEQNWGLGTLGRGDLHSQSIVNAFDFSMAPRAFQPIGSTYSRRYFLHQPLSDEPPDSE